MYIKRQAALSLSWTSLSLFQQCKRCFYKVQVLKLKRPGMDPDCFALNNAVDALWKREFDQYRKEQSPHPIMIKSKITAIPFEHESLSRWRDYRGGGIRYVNHENSIELFGVIDDIWANVQGQLIIVDYKATVKHTQFMTYATRIKWTESNERQMAFYAYLFKKNNFAVHDTGYFIYSAALKTASLFNQRLDFESAVVPCAIDDSWIEPAMEEIRSCLGQNDLPEPVRDCEYCGYDIIFS